MVVGAAFVLSPLKIRLYRRPYEITPWLRQTKSVVVYREDRFAVYIFDRYHKNRQIAYRDLVVSRSNCICTLQSVVKFNIIFIFIHIYVYIYIFLSFLFVYSSVCVGVCIIYICICMYIHTRLISSNRTYLKYPWETESILVRSNLTLILSSFSNSTLFFLKQNFLLLSRNR